MTDLIIPGAPPAAPVNADVSPADAGGRIHATSLPTSQGGPAVELLQAGAGATLGDLRRAARARSAAPGSERRVSRSYAFPYALVAHHDASVGIDVERVEPCDVVFAASICTPAELETLRVLDWGSVISLWSSKEALAKALGDARLYDPRRLDGPAGWSQGRSGPWRARALTIAPDYRAWLCWREASASDTRARLPSTRAITGP